MENWKRVAISEITNNLDNRRVPLNSKERRAKEKFKKYPYVGANNIMGYIDEYIFDEQILCVAEDGGNWGFLSKCSVIINEKCWVNNHAHVLTVKNNLKLEYLNYYLNYADLNSYITGSTRGKLTKGALNKIKIPLPPLATQQHIVQVLDKAQALKANLQTQLSDYEKMGESLFLEMFGDVSKDIKFPITKVGDITIIVRDGPHVSPKYSDEGIPILSTRNIRPFELLIKETKYVSKETYKDLTKRFKPQKGDVLITKGGTTGFAKIVDWDWKFCIWVHLAAIRVDMSKVSPKYLESALNTHYCYHQSQLYTKGIANKDLGLKRMVNIELPLPPLALQNQFAKSIQNLESQKQALQAQLAEAEALFNKLLQMAFKGELLP